MKKILLKVYFTILKSVGIDIFDMDIYHDISKKSVLVKEKIHSIFENKYDEYDIIIDDISKIKCTGFGFSDYVFDIISDDTIKTYCIDNNIEYSIFKDKYLSDISSFVEKRYIYKIIILFGEICDNIQDFYIFRKYFEFKTYKKSILRYIKGETTSRHIFGYIEEDKTGYLKDFYHASLKETE